MLSLVYSEDVATHPYKVPPMHSNYGQLWHSFAHCYSFVNLTFNVYGLCAVSGAGSPKIYYGVSGVLVAIRGVRTSSSFIYCKIRLVRYCIVL